MLILRPFAKLVDIACELLAFFTIALIAFLYLNNSMHITKSADTLHFLATIREYMIMATVILVGLKFAMKRNILIFVLFIIMALLAIAFSFTPGAMSTFI